MQELCYTGKSDFIGLKLCQRKLDEYLQVLIAISFHPDGTSDFKSYSLPFEVLIRGLVDSLTALIKHKLDG